MKSTLLNFLTGFVFFAFLPITLPMVLIYMVGSVIRGEYKEYKKIKRA